jgi:hypothetical protein
MSGLAFFKKKEGAEGWRGNFSRSLSQLNKFGGSGNFGPNQPTQEVIEIAARIPEDVKKGILPFDSVLVMATSEGGVQIKWQDLHREFSIFIYPDRTLEYLLRDAEGESTSGPLRSIDEVNEVIH